MLTRSTLPAAIVLLLDAIYPVPSQRTTFALVIERCAAVERLLSPLRAATYRGSTAAVLKSLASVDELLRDTTRAAEAAQAAEQAELEQARQAKLSAIVAPPIDVYGPGGMMMGVGGTTAASGGDQTLGGMLHDLDFGKCLGGDRIGVRLTCRIHAVQQRLVLAYGQFLDFFEGVRDNTCKC